MDSTNAYAGEASEQPLEAASSDVIGYTDASFYPSEFVNPMETISQPYGTDDSDAVGYSPHNRSPNTDPASYIVHDFSQGSKSFEGLYRHPDQPVGADPSSTNWSDAQSGLPLTLPPSHASSGTTQSVQGFEGIPSLKGAKRPFEGICQSAWPTKRQKVDPTIYHDSSLEERRTDSRPSKGIDMRASQVLFEWLDNVGTKPTPAHARFLARHPDLVGVSPETILEWFGTMPDSSSTKFDSGYTSHAAVAQPRSIDSPGTERSKRSHVKEMELPPPEAAYKLERLDQKALQEHYRLPCKSSSHDVSSSHNESTEARYQCTRACGYQTKKRSDWKRHQERECLQIVWVCSCCSVGSTHTNHVYHRSDQLEKHVKTKHHNLAEDFPQIERKSRQDTGFPVPTWCGFCSHHCVEWQADAKGLPERLTHIAEHFDKGKRMKDWNIEDRSSMPVNTSGHRDDNTDSGSGDAPNGGHSSFLDSHSSSSNHGDGGDQSKRFLSGNNASDEGKRSSGGSTESGGGRKYCVNDNPSGERKIYPRGIHGRRGPHKEDPDISSLTGVPRNMLLSIRTHARGQATLSKLRDAPVCASQDRSQHMDIWYANGCSITFFSLRLLGQGSSAFVDEIIDLKTGMRLARKQFRAQIPIAMGSFYRELKALRSLNHPCISRVRGYVHTKTTKTLLMSPVADMNLAEYFIQYGNISRRIGLSLSVQLVSAISHVHEQGIIHHDLKPTNVLICERGSWSTLQLSDFGSSHFSGNRTNEATGITPMYAPPEFASGAESALAGFEWDIWSLGCVLLEMITVVEGYKPQSLRLHLNHRTFSSSPILVKAWIDTLQNKANGAIILWDELRLLLSWVRRMLATNPLERPTAAELLDNLPCNMLVPNPSCLHGQRQTNIHIL